MDALRRNAPSLCRGILPILLGSVLVLYLLSISGADSAAASPDSLVPSQREDPQKRRARLLDNLGVSTSHQAGFRGRGLKVAVLDTGFSGYRDQLGKSLPEKVTTKSFRVDRNL